MPRYFFNVHNGQAITDDVGIDLPSLKQAQVIAIRHAASLLERDDVFWDGHEWKMNVVDETGKLCFTLTFTGSDLAGLLNVKDIP